MKMAKIKKMWGSIQVLNNSFKKMVRKGKISATQKELSIKNNLKNRMRISLLEIKKQLKSKYYQTKNCLRSQLVINDQAPR